MLISRRGMLLWGQVEIVNDLYAHLQIDRSRDRVIDLYLHLSDSAKSACGLTCRGSAGFGKAFEHAGDRGWGVGPMQHDLTDAVRWAIDSGLADPGRIAIFGASYGGYATLAGAPPIPKSSSLGIKYGSFVESN